MTGAQSTGAAASAPEVASSRVRWWWIVRASAAAIACIYLLVAGVLAGCQERLIYCPPHHDPADRPRGPAAVELVSYRADGGTQQAYFIPARHPSPDGPIWFVFGGNAACAIGWGPFANACPDDRAAFLLCDYPGYGANPGSPSPQTTRVAMDAAAAALANHLGLTEAALDARSAVVAHSLGCAIGLAYATRHAVSRIVLVAPFTSMLSMARRVIGWPLCEVLTHRFDNVASIERIVSAGPPPITIIHGTADEVIPVTMGRTLAHRWPTAIRYIEIPDATHNGIIDEDAGIIYAAMQR
jgi:hypothetical protein